jgi:nucleotide-binding universal stress UspA family protein
VIRFRQILCPVDFSPFSRRALDHAALLARWYEADLTVLHVSPLMPTMFASEPALSAATLSPFDKEAVSRDLRAFVGSTLETTPTPRLVLRSGAAAAQILGQAAETKTDLIVLGTHGRTGFERLMLGSVTEKVVRKSPCPVLTVPAHAEGMPDQPLFARILCGVDFSETSDRAVQYALSLAQEAKGRLTLLHVLEWLPDRSLAEYPQFNLEQYRRSLVADARARLEALVPEEARNWCQADTHVATGKPYQEILRMAREDSADLIVMGNHGGGSLDRMLFGSVTQQLVRQATCPVMTVRPTHDEA